MDVALPRVKARRRRIKPPPPHLLAMAILLAISLILLFANLVLAALGSTVNMAAAGVGIASLCVTWPLFRREWDRWRRDS